MTLSCTICDGSGILLEDPCPVCQETSVLAPTPEIGKTMRISVALMSGNLVVEGIDLPGTEAVSRLRAEAESAVGQRLSVLISPSGRTLRCHDKLQASGLQDGDVITACISDRTTASICASEKAFAALCVDGSVVAWGDPQRGGSCSTVQERLSSDVQQLRATSGAFAALLGDGSVCTWGGDEWGGNSSCVKSQLSSAVTQLFSSSAAFAALKEDGSVVAWGSSKETKGASNSLWEHLSNDVEEIFSTDCESLALREDGSIVAWDVDHSTFLQAQVAGEVSHLCLTSGHFGDFNGHMIRKAVAALKCDGSVVAFGDWNWGGDCSQVRHQLASGVRRVFASDGAFASLRGDGSVITWGNADRGGDCSIVSEQLKDGIVNVFSTWTSFAALKADGSVVTWGGRMCGSSEPMGAEFFSGDSTSVREQLRNGVQNISSTADAFAALTVDGSVVTWGNLECGGDSRNVQHLLDGNVESICATRGGYYDKYGTLRCLGAFAALTLEGGVVAWGSAEFGADTTPVSERLTHGVQKVYATLGSLNSLGGAFAAVKHDGAVVTWGSRECGGDSSTAQERLAYSS